MYTDVYIITYTQAFMASGDLRLITSQLPIGGKKSEWHRQTNGHTTGIVSAPFEP
jgi:hypothetical protein